MFYSAFQLHHPDTDTYLESFKRPDKYNDDLLAEVASVSKTKTKKKKGHKQSKHNLLDDEAADSPKGSRTATAPDAAGKTPKPPDGKPKKVRKRRGKGLSPPKPVKSNSVVKLCSSLDSDVPSVNSLWLLESEHAVAGGLADWKNKFRLKSIETGGYLM